MDLGAVVQLALGLALVAALGAWAVHRRRARLDVRIARPPATARVIPIVPPPTEQALAALRLPVRACPECGYLGIRPSEVLDFAGGGGLASAQTCPHCGYRGPPAEFDATSDYAEYVNALHRAGRAKR